jgi:hypothetical protein
MSTLTFVSNINTPKEKVWGALWNDGSYRKWTVVIMILMQKAIRQKEVRFYFSLQR